MQAVILCAGKSSRFYPLNCFTHKANTPLLGKPIYEHTLKSIKDSGITNVVIVTGPDNFIEKKIGNGESMGLKIRYVIQDEPKGMGAALLNAQDFLDESFFLLHAHHVDFAEHKEKMLQNGKDVVLLAKEEDDVTHFGVLKIENNKVIGIVEKPKKGEEPSHLRLIGVYLLNKKFIQNLEIEKEDHYNFETALTTFMSTEDVGFVTTELPVVTLKYPWNLLDINKVLLERARYRISDSAEIAENVVIEGKVIIEDGVKIESGAILKGPLYIGKNSFIGDNVILRGNVSIGECVTVGAGMEVKNSIVFSNSSFHAGYIGDSVIGPENKIAGFFVTANVRLDRGEISVQTEKGQVGSGKNRLGVITGSNVKIGVRVTSMPGVIIGSSVIIGPNTTVAKNIADDSKYYTKFQEIIESTGGEKVSLENVDVKEKIVLFDIDYTLFNTGIFKESQLENYKVYDEVIDTLVALKEYAILGIFSEGELDFQSKKLERTDIYKHFLSENIHIVDSKDEKLKEVLEKYNDKEIVLVDDKLTVLNIAKTLLPEIVTIWVKRGIYAENQDEIPGFKADIIVTNLQVIPEVIKSL